MLVALLELLDKKRRHYSSARLGFDNLCLVVFYNRAVFYNTPVETLHFTFEDAARVASSALSDDRGPFDQTVFVFDAIAQGRLFRIA